MKNGHKMWTDNVLKELQDTIEYLQEHWSDKELRNLANNLEKTLNLISNNPNLFQSSEYKKDIRRAVVMKLNTLYYKVNENTVEIISFFSNRQNPIKRKL
jgi:plasmid stabilization system protein ParE